MKCPACNSNLQKENVNGIEVDICKEIAEGFGLIILNLENSMSHMNMQGILC